MNAAFPDIRSLVPHAGTMCLLERISTATDSGITCITSSHRSATNPLRSNGRLAALHLAEYGAQAMAAHGGLQNPAAAAEGGMLVAIRDLRLNVARLDDLEGELEIHATRLMANAGGRIYSFSASVAGRIIGSGRVSVMNGAGS
jgi:predicted hotdog family 3-hydroxylacyl-ACP dehydratase